MPIPTTLIRKATGQHIGLSELARQDWLARCHRETTARFQLVLDLTAGQRVGVIRGSAVDRLYLHDAFYKRSISEKYIVAVLKLHGYTAEQVDIGIAFQKEANHV